jgi:hypothetical protein
MGATTDQSDIPEIIGGFSKKTATGVDHLIGFRRDRREAVFLFAPIMLRCMSLLLALSGHSNRTRVCPLLNQHGQRWILARDGLSANDP